MSASYVFTPRVFPLGALPDAGELVARLASHAGLVALDSAGGVPRDWSLVAFDPLRAGTLPAELAGLSAFTRTLARRGGDEVPGPFHGGFVGALAYDLGVAGECAQPRLRDGERAHTLLRDVWGTPLVAGGLYVDFLVRDEHTGAGWLVLGDAPGDARDDVDSRRARLERELAAPAPDGGVTPRGPLVRHTPGVEHRRRIDALRERIAAGDLYQANLAHRFTRAVAARPADLYRRLRAVNPAPYMAFLAWDAATSAGARGTPRGVLLSASPELLLEFAVSASGARARTRPIKGTAPRGHTPEEDRARAEALLASEKDRAELAMIVDLERNDLGRCAVAGGVRVERFPELESYASVHHLAADVCADIAPGKDAFDVLAALFPGGSISGAPKLASLAAIAALEGAGRGFFSGSAGFVDTRGAAVWNILIRTLVWRPVPGALADAGEVSFHVGGGITWASDAAVEDAETLAKGLALARALAAPGEEPYASLTAGDPA